MSDEIDLTLGEDASWELTSGLREPRSHELYVGRYVIRRPLGKGGMGKVFEAYDAQIGRAVALKLMRSQARDRPSLVQRFRREYRAMARIEHPGVPKVFDAGEDEQGRSYFTMELVSGQPLPSAFGEPADPSDALALIEKVARILVEVHAAGIIHRDIKPSNILIDPEFRPTLIDFGACYLKEAEVGPTLGQTEGELRTARGTWLGTLGYIDPAALEGAPCGVRSDIYSLTATLSWLLTLEHPSSDPLAPVPRTGLPQIDAILKRGMARNPEERPTSVTELILDIMEARGALRPTLTEVRSPPTQVRQTTTRRFSPLHTLALGIVGGILGGPVLGMYFEGSVPSACAAEEDPAEQRLQIPLKMREPLPEVVTSPSEGLRDAPAAEQAENLPNGVKPTPVHVSPPTFTEPRTQALSKKDKTLPSKIRILHDWKLASNYAKSWSEQCLRDAKVFGHNVEIFSLADSPAGRLRYIKVRGVRGRAKACILRELKAIRFEPRPRPFRWHLELRVDRR